MKTIIIILAAGLSIISLSGCATAKAGAEEPVPALFQKTTASIMVEEFDPGKEFVYSWPDGSQASMRGISTVLVTISPPGRAYQVEQSPDLVNWVQSDPLYSVLQSRSPESETYKLQFQVLGDPEDDDQSRQFFRVVFR